MFPPRITPEKMRIDRFLLGRSGLILVMILFLTITKTAQALRFVKEDPAHPASRQALVE